MRSGLMCLVLSALMLAPVVAVGADQTDVCALGSRLEPIMDTYLVESLENATLKLHPPRIAESVLTFDNPWEGRYCGYVTILKDGDVYRMYYRGLPEARADGSDSETTCYAVSVDGIHFTKPSLGLFEYNGSRDNNIILAGHPPFSHNFAPFIDTKPGVPAEERYKALAGTHKTGLVAFVSADGVRWKKWREAPLITEGAFDSQNVGFWSESEQQYVCYFRTWTENTWGGFRWVSRSTSPDFATWTDAVEMDNGGAVWEHIYTNQTIPYFRAPHLYVSVAARFMPGRRVITPEEAKSIGVIEKYAGDCSDNVLMTSRGGTLYDRTHMEALIKPAIGPENWMSRTNYPARGIVQTGESEMSVYVQHKYGQLDAYVRRFVCRLDGLASVHAGYDGGVFTTKPLTFTGNELYMNYATSAAGNMFVEILDADGKPVPGFTKDDCKEIIGNRIAGVVTWGDSTDLSGLAGKTVQLRISMKDADLYALQFK